MKSFSSQQCAWRVCAVLALLGVLLLAAGCGSGGSLPQVLGGNFTNASLKGQYVISQTGTGFDSAGNVAHFSEAIVFTADGNGNVTGGIDDFNRSGQSFEDNMASSAYSINRDGTGTLIISIAGGSSTYAITMIDDSHFYIIEQDSFATASGYGEKQDTTAMTAPPSGNFVFQSHTIDASSRVGGINFTGTTITGNEDLLNLGILSTPQTLTGSVMTPPDANGHGTLTLSDGTALSYFYYVVSAGKFRFLSNTGSLEIGQAEAQSGTFSLATLASGNSYVFGSGGDTTVSGAAGIHSAGVFSTDGNGNITGGQVDSVQDTTVNSGLMVAGGNYTLISSGRGTINLTLSGGTISPQIFWMVNPTSAYFLVNSSAAVEDGAFTQQQGGPFTALGNQAAFVMDGFDVAFKDRVGAFQPTSSNNFKWKEAANSFDANPLDISFGGTPTPFLGTNGTLQVDPNGRAAATVNNITGSLVLYLVSPGSGFMVQEDADIGGAFQMQAGQ